MGFERQRAFERNEELEGLLREINGILGPVEHQITDDYGTPTYPVVLLVACARSGSTLVLQWLARTGNFAYPTNLLSRFYAAPYIGAKIQQMLLDPKFNFRDELGVFAEEVPFASSLGKTKGALAPNEFWYFWRRFFPYGDLQYLDEQELERVDTATFVAELAALESAFDKPLALKGLIINWNIPFVSGLLDKALFVYVRRHPLYNAQSLLEARAKYYGDRRGWYSFKPREYEQLKNLDPYEQVAGQVYFTNRAVEEGLLQIEASRSLEVSYEEFCEDPEQVFHHLRHRLAQQGCEVDAAYSGPKQFQHTNQIRLPRDEWQRIATAYTRFSGVELTV